MAIGRTNTGGGGTGATLTVTTHAGVTVTASKDGKTYTKSANADGLAVFKGLKTGVWTVTITDGVQTSLPRLVEVTAEYTVLISLFATIDILYPAGIICTCSDGTTTLTAPDTSGAWTCLIPNAGTWTVRTADGDKITENAVEITESGQEKRLAYLYLPGNTCDSVTGDWINKAWAANSNGYSGASFTSLVRNDDNITMVFKASGGKSTTLCTKNAIDLTGYSTLLFKGTFMGSKYFSFFAAKASATYYMLGGGITTVADVNGFKRYAVDVSKLTGEYLVGIGIAQNANGQTATIAMTEVVLQ